MKKSNSWPTPINKLTTKIKRLNLITIKSVELEKYTDEKHIKEMAMKMQT
jgi:hypothetical protein